MKTSLRMSVVAALTAAFATTGAVAAEKSFDIGGNSRYEILYNNKGNNTSDTTGQSGYIELNAIGKMKLDNGAFVEVKAQPNFNLDGGADVDDAYVKIGRGAWDIQMGRFEAMDGGWHGDQEMYGADSGRYEANTLRGRSSNAAHIAGHFKSGNMTYELGFMHGNESVAGTTTIGYRDTNGDGNLDTGFATTTPSSEQSITGFRPGIKYSGNRFDLGAVIESYSKDTDYEQTGGVDNASTSTNGLGYGLNARIKNVGPGAIQLTYAALTEEYDDGNFGTTEYDSETQSWGINYNTKRFDIGFVGTEYSDGDNEDHDADDYSSAGWYADYKMPIFGSKDATFAVGFAQGVKESEARNAEEENSSVLGARVSYNF